MKILVVDDHAIVRQGVQRLLSTLPNAVVYEAATSHEALACARNQHPDVVVLDINLEGASGLELLRRLRIENSSVRVLMFSMHSEAIYANRALQAGAYGYVCKSAGADELTTGVLRVFQGERYLDTTLAGELAMSAVRAEDPMRNLTNREIEILRMLGEGKSLQGIADAIGIAYKTVANSCGRIKEKLDLPRTSDLIRFSIENRRN
ncbi:MAG: response regulator transcription factor [Hyphomicrobium sp.]|jgi:DNA-binding NarL/FixJ family response regulator|uniref:response regulator transcription factor n=1 Tax=Hyphomicrobium sp. TaxID=82 RepID=UPI0025C638AE|nr:response regulator transcription factor [Hyphomicrobium sp.]MBX9862309.1 response regulator transcription factor [Hyphomicrobium sp.]